MSFSFRSISLSIAGIFLFLVLILAANSVGFFGDALEPFIGPFVESTSLTGETFTTGRSGAAGTTGATSGSTVRPTPTVRR